MTSFRCLWNDTPRRNLRISPAPRAHPAPDQPPTQADFAQAAAMADLLAQLIADCDTRLVALDVQAAQAARDGAFRAARLIHAKSLHVRRELDELYAMQHRLIRRFFAAGSPRAAVPYA